LYHLKTNLWETVGKKNATKLYNTNQTFQDIVDMMAALSYCRADLVTQFFDEAIEPLIESLPEDFPDAAFKYIDYVTRTYVGKRAGRSGSRRAPMFKPEMWTVFDEVLHECPTTNNALEAWNGRFNSTKLPCNNIWNHITSLQGEDSLAYERYLTELSNVINPDLSPEEGRQRKVKHREKMAKLKNIGQRIDEVDATEYLSVVASIIKKNNFSGKK